MAQGQEMPIFTKTFDLVLWLLPVTDRFPRERRFTLTQRLLNAAFDLREHLEAAQFRSGKERMERLALADEALARLRFYVRLAARLEWVTGGQYQHVAQMMSEVGKLLGGWRKVTKT